MRRKREIFSDIVNLNISEETLDLNKAYTLLLINVNQDLNNFKILKISNSFYLKLNI